MDDSERNSGSDTGRTVRRSSGSSITDLRPRLEEQPVVVEESTNGEQIVQLPRPNKDGDLPHWSERPSMTSEEHSQPDTTAPSSRWDRNSKVWGSGDGEGTLDDLSSASGLGSGGAQGGGKVDRSSDATWGSENKDAIPVDKALAEHAIPSARERAVALKSSPSLFKRALTAAVVTAGAAAAFLGGPPFVLALAVIVMLLCAVEALDGFRRVGYRPVTFLALVGVLGVMVGAYLRGEAALPLMLALVMMFTFLWFLAGASKAAPSANIAVTILVFVWIGLFGSYAALMLRMPDDRGMAFLLGAVFTTVVYDVCAYLGGSVLGRRPLAKSISPNKTWEGLIAGTVAAVVVGAVAVSAISPWGVASGALLGLVVALVSPVGDLAESMVKRDLGLKDMGRLLPGHGGALDRFDGLLFALPATYYLVHMLNLV